MITYIFSNINVFKQCPGKAHAMPTPTLRLGVGGLVGAVVTITYNKLKSKIRA